MRLVWPNQPFKILPRSLSHFSSEVDTDFSGIRAIFGNYLFSIAELNCSFYALEAGKTLTSALASSITSIALIRQMPFIMYLAAKLCRRSQALLRVKRNNLCVTSLTRLSIPIKILVRAATTRFRNIHLFGSDEQVLGSFLKRIL